MKKILLCLALLCSFTTVWADSAKEVIVNNCPTSSPRSVTQKPKVFVDEQMCQLSVSFAKPEAAFTMYLYDQSGNELHQEVLITDGGRHIYCLPILESGVYTIRIESAKEAFEGEFTLVS